MELLSSGAHREILSELAKAGGGVELDVASADFSLFGIDALFEAKVIPTRLRLLLDVGFCSESGLSISRHDARLRNTLRTRARAAKLQEQLGRASVRGARLPLGQSLILTKPKTAQPAAYVGNCALTTDGLGAAPQQRLGFVQRADAAQELAMLGEWFEAQWTAADDSAAACLDTVVERLAAKHGSEVPYHLALNRLFADMGDVASEDRIVDTATGITATRIWSKLYRFQRDGVIGAIDKLDRFGGCILADSVGLGKTFEALAVIKYHELRNDRVLVLAPKRLRENWTLWKANDVRNDLAADRFAYDVMNHTDLSRERGLSGDIDLEHINWGNYNLVVIDESHNFRNRPSGAEHDSRYDRLMNRVMKAGVKTRVLMLSATPVNNRLNDLKNQIAFATEGDDRALVAHGIANISATIRLAQSQFKKWQELPDERRSSAKLLEMLGFDYFRLLDLLTIARSRKHIAKYYGTAETGVFPDKLPPINVKADTDISGVFPPIGHINAEIRRLSLAAYSPLKYVLPSKRDAYDRRYNQQVKDGASVFRQVDREESLVALMRINLLKRMESSVHAFALTIERQLADVTALIERIDRHDDSIEAPEIDVMAEDDPLIDELGVGRRVRVLLSDADLVRWRQDLGEDRARLTKMLTQARAVTPARDAKLAELKALIAAKQTAPYNAGNRKLLVFTAFSDTAAYLYDAIQGDFPGSMALVTGNANKTTHTKIRAELGPILTAFSPQSRGRPESLASEAELDLIIATDCISEGQNLQDCDCVVNYDIHWNPVRIVQRFGRIDRLGSPNTRIQLVNFWPNLDLDAYIGLERTVSGRMKLLDVSATGEENIIEAESGDRMNDLDYRRKQLEALQERAIDLDDMASGVSITDMTLNDLRLDLAQLDAAEREELPLLPIGLYSVLPESADLPAGALFVLRAETDAARNCIAAADPLRPHVLVYVGADERIFVSPSEPKRALDLLRLAATRPADANADAWARFDKATKGGDRMDAWVRLLQVAIDTITGRAEERAAESLFSTSGAAGAGGASGLDDWEVVSWLAIIPHDG
jgi:superfamily II DNA or RNA helicase